MSMVMRFSKPSAAPAARAPTTPPTGPEKSVSTALSSATAELITPPLDSVMKTGTWSPSACSAPFTCSRYVLMIGVM